MARWEKRLDACKYAKCGKTKMDGWIADKRVRAKKDEGGHSAPVYIDLDSIDEMFQQMKPALGSPRKRRNARASTEAARPPGRDTERRTAQQHRPRQF